MTKKLPTFVKGILETSRLFHENSFAWQSSEKQWYVSTLEDVVIRIKDTGSVTIYFNDTTYDMHNIICGDTDELHNILLEYRFFKEEEYSKKDYLVSMYVNSINLDENLYYDFDFDVRGLSTITKNNKTQYYLRVKVKHITRGQALNFISRVTGYRHDDISTMFDTDINENCNKIIFQE